MQKLNKNGIYFLYELGPGDRFYIKGDRKKTVYQVNDVHPFEYKMQVGFKIHYCNCRTDTRGPGQLAIIRFKTNRHVIFLRNIKDL